jgi:poly(hydroxyalkanoate) granule-associated protein
VLRRARKALNAKNNDTVEEKSVAKKSKKLAKKGGNYELVAQIQGSANEIWLAGLGAFDYAQKEGGVLFDALVKQGEAIQKRVTKTAGQTIADVKVTTSKSWGKLEKVFEAGVANALHTFNVPTKKEFDALSRRVAELGSATKRRSAAMATSSHRRRRSAHT